MYLSHILFFICISFITCIYLFCRLNIYGIYGYNHFEVWHGVQWQGVKTLAENRKQPWHALTATDEKATTVSKSNHFIQSDGTVAELSETK